MRPIALHDAPRPGGRLVTLACAAAAAGMLALASLGGSARADITPAQVLDGPVNDILDVDGAALAPDGTGGIVYRKEIDGVIHLFVVSVHSGHWGTPIEADTDDLYGASEPTIGAADNGALLVAWVQPRAVLSSGTIVYELMSAYMGPGASSFGPSIVVDPTVSEPYTGDYANVDPRIAMAPDGDAYVVYRVVDDDCATLDSSNPYDDECPIVGSGATSQVVEIRMARFAQGPWSTMGAINRAPQLPLPDPSASNEPSVAIGDGKTGLVVWQEPDATGIPRIWARRLFGTTVGNVIQLSPSSVNGVSVGAAADSPAAGFDDTGLATASFRLQGGSGSPYGANGEVMSQVVPAEESQISPATDVAGGPTISSPSLAEDKDGDTRIAYVSGGEAYATNSSGANPVALGAASGGQPFTSVDPAGGGVTVWPGSQNGLPVTDVMDDFPGGGSQFGELVGGAPGPITGLSFGSDPDGDAVVAWMQGPPGESEVVGSVADSTPQTFTVSVPKGWVAARRARISWDPAEASTSVTYSVEVNGRPVLSGLHGPSVTSPSSNPNFPSRPVSSTGEAASIVRSLPLAGLGSGVRNVQVVATDADGQTMSSADHTLKIDRTPPLVSIAHVDGGRGVRVTVTDADSGVAVSATRVAFGDGSSTHGRARIVHAYRRGGTYTIVAHVVDKVGNAATVHLRVTVR